MVLLILGAMISASEPLSVIAVPIVLLIMYTDIPVSVKRLHDSGCSGLLLLASIVPLFGLLYVFWVCGITKGNEGDNTYGPPPSPLF